MARSVSFQNIIAAEEGVRYPVCMEGGSATPPDDSGGAPDYCDLLDTLENPNGRCGVAGR